MKLTWKQEALYRAMSEISEDCYCAGWMLGNEFTLWTMLLDEKESRAYGQSEVSADDLILLREISKDIDGWIYWHDDENDSALTSDQRGPRFIAMADWVAMYGRHIDAELHERRRTTST